MELDSQQYVLSPVDSDDVGKQRCRLRTDVIKTLGVPIGSYVGICLKEAAYVCGIWPNNTCPDGFSVKFDKYVTSTKILKEDNTENVEILDSAAQEITCKIRPLAVSGAVCASLTVIVNNMEKYIQWKKHLSVQNLLKQKCLSCLRKKCITANCTVNLEKSTLGKSYAIVLLQIDTLTTKTDSEGGIVTESTKLDINNVQSEERYLLSSGSPQVAMGGVSKIADDLKDLLNLPLKHAGDFTHIGLPCPKGILLRGPPGCGKTSLVRNLAQSSQAALVIINGPEILSPHPGESEENVRGIFHKAIRLSREGPCILFIDEIDSVCPRRGKTGSSNDGRVTSAVMSSMDDLSDSDGLVVIGATNRPSVIDPALRRPGRFDREILMNVPNRDHRYEILAIHSQHLPLAEDVDLGLLADLTNGYVGADLASLCNEAAYRAMEQRMMQDQASKPSIRMSDFLSAVHTVVPSIQKGAEGLIDLQPVLWNDIGGLETVKVQIRQAVEWPMLYPDSFTRMGLSPPRGVLLYGPPGCCKTTLVRAAATETKAAFVSLSGAQLYSPFVGDSERMVTEVFEKSRAMSPTILFLDEIDSIVGKRSDGKSHRGVQERVLSTLLNEMDGVGIRLDTKTDSVSSVRFREAEGAEMSKGVPLQKQDVDNNKVLVVAATNRPDLVDEAILRPGRIDRIIYVPPPDEQTRHEILKVHTRKMPLRDVSLDIIAHKTPFYTGADLENLCKEAALCSLTESLTSDLVTMRHFTTALNIVKPSLSTELVDKYRNLGNRYRTS